MHFNHRCTLRNHVVSPPLFMEHAFLNRTPAYKRDQSVEFCVRGPRRGRDALRCRAARRPTRLPTGQRKAVGCAHV